MSTATTIADGIELRLQDGVHELALAAQSGKFDATARRAAKAFIKPLPVAELARERDLFVQLAEGPALLTALKRFVESTELRPYLP